MDVEKIARSAQYGRVQYRITRERLAAYEAVNETIRAITSGRKMSIGQVVDNVLATVEEVCNAGRLGVRIQEYERNFEMEN